MGDFESTEAEAAAGRREAKADLMVLLQVRAEACDVVLASDGPGPLSLMGSAYWEERKRLLTGLLAGLEDA